MKANEAKELGAKLGAEAFAAGIKSAPALDRKVREAIGTMPGDTAAVLALLDGWNAAWHAANLAAPVE